MTTGLPIAEGAATPLFILTGFLGAGKTTLLSKLVRCAEFADTAVIVNEFGEVGLDHALVTEGQEDDVVLLDSGCLCCALNNSLAETLTDLFHRRARGEIPAFDRVVVETTGIADPAPLIHTLMTDRHLAARFRLGAVVTCVDATFFKVQQDRFDEVVKQIAVADRLIVIEADQVDGAALGEVEEALRGLNAGAEILISRLADLQPERVVAEAPVAATDGDRPQACPEGEHRHDHAPHSSGLSTVFVPVDSEVSWPAYAKALDSLQRRVGARLLRAKGVLRFRGEPQPLVIQGVQHVFAKPAPLPRGASGLVTGLTLIGLNLEGDPAIEDLGKLLSALPAD